MSIFRITEGSFVDLQKAGEWIGRNVVCNKINKNDINNPNKFWVDNDIIYNIFVDLQMTEEWIGRNILTTKSRKEWYLAKTCLGMIMADLKITKIRKYLDDEHCKFE